LTDPKAGKIGMEIYDVVCKYTIMCVYDDEPWRMQMINIGCSRYFSERM
jgi:hypothetical protein